MTVSRSRIDWLCRRGVRELDLLLTRFVGHHYDGLSDRDKHTLEELLNMQDPELMDWLWGRQPTPTQELGRLIERIRNDVKT